MSKQPPARPPAPPQLNAQGSTNQLAQNLLVNMNLLQNWQQIMNQLTAPRMNTAQHVQLPGVTPVSNQRSVNVAVAATPPASPMTTSGTRRLQPMQPAPTVPYPPTSVGLSCTGPLSGTSTVLGQRDTESRSLPVSQAGLGRTSTVRQTQNQRGRKKGSKNRPKAKINPPGTGKGKYVCISIKDL